MPHECESHWVANFTKHSSFLGSPRCEPCFDCGCNRSVGQAGKLVQVDLKISMLAPTGNFIVSIFALPGGIGSEEMVLKSSTSAPVATLPSSMPGGTGPQYVSFFPTPQFNVSPGDVLAIVAHKDTGGTGAAYGIFWIYGNDDYPEGSAMRYDSGSVQACPAFGHSCPPPTTEPSWVEFQVSVPGQGVQTRDFAFRTVVAGSSVPTSGPIAQPLIVLAVAGSATTVLAKTRRRRT
jgi:hypothetical protein